MNAISPLGVVVKLGRVCRECVLYLENHDLPVDLIVLTMKEFDVILGIDWLIKFHANWGCVNMLITFAMPGSQPFTFQCNQVSEFFS